MKRILLLVILIVGLGYYFSTQHSIQQAPKPQPTKQEISVVYSQMDVAEAIALQCQQVGSTSSYVCPLVGAGGGHAFED